MLFVELCVLLVILIISVWNIQYVIILNKVTVNIYNHNLFPNDLKSITNLLSKMYPLNNSIRMKLIYSFKTTIERILPFDQSIG